MLKRFPHTGTIIINSEISNENGIPTISKIELLVKGRYEPSGQSKALDYSAKWYCDKLDLTPYEADGKSFKFNGKQFKIVQLFNYQSHCEIWLE
ncbi:hypothetical protein [Lutibacter maritimus]|uniref:Uncharacterized protein n=1 Tax=Lutibacter maritimus TaxID=593133 RepID=A0A1I6NSC9_9FLAO|nr:hypothetical protein [Lutibacter maritimus]SFS30780.1 hypothetical protein SAMN04488006_0484 [Lutibacter maritimus]